jgi:hypothetical protein
MRVLMLAGLGLLSGCGGGGTTGTNYSDPPPMAEIVATPSPKASPTVEVGAVSNITDDAGPVENEAETANSSD